MPQQPSFWILLWCCAATASFAAERNIVFFITDDESPTLGCYGDPAAVTPHTDALAALLDFAEGLDPHRNAPKNWISGRQFWKEKPHVASENLGPDMKKDPNATKNLAGNPGYAAVLEKYQARLKQFQKEQEDPWLQKWDYE